MSRFIPIELHHASRLLNHGPTVLITSFDEQSQRRNIMAAAWSMPVEFEPPRVAIVVDKSTWTRELIEHNGKFGIVIPGVAATNWTWAVGSVSGRDEDKFNCYGIPVVRGPVFGLPLVEEKMSGVDGVSIATCDFCARRIRHAVWRSSISSGRRTGICRRPLAV